MGYHEGIPTINVLTRGDELEVRTHHDVWNPDEKTKKLLSKLLGKLKNRRWIDCREQGRKWVPPTRSRSTESKNRILQATINAFLVALIAEYDSEDYVQ